DINNPWAVNVNLNGTLDVQSGTVILNGGGTSDGSYKASGATAKLNFGGGTHTLNATSSVSGAGTIGFSSGSVNIGGPYTVSGQTLINGGTANFNAAASTGMLELDSGALGGTGALSVSGLTTGAGGTMQDAGITNANGGMTINGSDKILSARTLNIAAGTTATWTGGNINSSPGATINVSGTWDVETDADFANQSGGPAAINILANATLKKTVATGVTDINNPWAVNVNLNGTLDVQSGTVILNGGGTSDGSYKASGATAKLNFGGGTHTLNATSSVSGAGTIGFSSGSVNIGGPYTVSGQTLINGGTANFNAAASTGMLELDSGALGGTGALSVSGLTTGAGGTMQDAGITNANGGMTINGSDKILSARTLNIAAGTTATWTGGNINSSPGATINVSGTWDVETDADFANQSGGPAAINILANATLKKTVATGVTDINNPWAVNVNLNGTLDVQSGTISLNGGGTSDGSYKASGATAKLNFGGGTHTLNATSSVSCAGTIGFSSGPVNIGGTYTVSGQTLINGGTANFNAAASTGTLELDSGALGDTGALSVSGLTTWAGGTMQDAGITNANGGMTINGSDKILSARTLNIAAGTTATWTGGNINSSPGATINVSGTWDVETDADFANQSGGPAAINILANATLKKTVATGVTDINNPWAVNVNLNGTLDVQSGTISLNGGGTSDGSYKASGATAKLNFGGGTHTLNATSSVSGAGTIGFSSGPVNIGGTYTVSGQTLINGGTANFNAAASTGTLELDSGALGGTGALSVSGLTTWAGGTMQDAGITNANGGMTINGSDKIL